MALDFIIANKEFFIFVFLLSVFLLLKRKRLDLQGTFPFLYILMYKTRLGLDRMDNWSKKHPKVFLYLSYLSIFIGLVGMVAVFVFMFWQLNFIVDNQITSGGGLVLPLETEDGNLGGVPVVAPPFMKWLIALLVLVVVHEFAHGVIAERFKVRVKSSGFAFMGSAIIGALIILMNFSLEKLIMLDPGFLVTMLVGIIFLFVPFLPAAFVEPDEESLKKKDRWKQIAVFGAGSTSNFIFGILFLLLFIFVTAPLVDSTVETKKISFGNVLNQSSLNEYGIESGTIMSVDGVEDKDEILMQFRNLSVNETFDMRINESGNITTIPVTTYEREGGLSQGNAMIGISALQIERAPKDGYYLLGNTANYLHDLFKWIWLLNIAIGMINLLPIWITDGGQIARVALQKYLSEANSMRVYNLLSIVSLALIILTLWPGILM